MADFALQESSKLISRKNWVIQKSWNFHTVVSTPILYRISFQMQWHHSLHHLILLSSWSLGNACRLIMERKENVLRAQYSLLQLSTHVGPDQIQRREQILDTLHTIYHVTSNEHWLCFIIFTNDFYEFRSAQNRPLLKWGLLPRHE